MALPSHLKEKDLAYWREKILFSILLGGLLMALVVFVPVGFLVVKKGMWGLAVVDMGAWITAVVLLFSPRIKYVVRASIVLLIFYGTGLTVIFSLGPLSGGPIWLFTFVIMTGALLGPRATLLALGINTGTLIFLCWLGHQGLLAPGLPFFPTTENMLAAVVNFMLLNAVVALSVAVLVKGIVSSHEHERLLARNLEKEMQERRRTEEALRNSEERFRLLSDVTMEGILIHHQGVAKDVNYSLTRLLGYEREEVIGKNLLEFAIHPDDRSIVRENIVKDYARPYIVRGVRKNGEVFFAELEARNLQIKGEVLRVAAVRDITERKKTEDALQESEERFRKSFDTELVAIAISRYSDGMFLDANPGFLKLTGYSREEVIGHTSQELNFFSPFERDILMEKLGKEGQLHDQELTFPTKSGEMRTILFSIGPVTIREEACLLATMVDITEHKQAEKEKKELEARFEQAQRMESIGTLAGGIAHDFNNLLMSIQGNASLMLMEKDSSDPEYESLKNIEESIQEGAGLTKQLLGFARGGRYEIKATDLNRLLKSQNRVFGSTSKEIKIHERYAEGLWPVEADQGQIQQVLMNLYVNASQAMPGGGDLYTETENVMIDEKYVKAYDVPPGRYVKMSLTDTGTGMDEKTKERIFEPFFTTKEMGRGTGLGLASVYGIVKNHGGFIDVYSEKGEGTTFNIYLPASEKEILEEKAATKEVVTGEGTILLVDDEERVIHVGERMLERLGYRVKVAKSGEEALDIYKENREQHIDLVILDMIMPGMSGGDTYDRLKEIDPDIKVLLASGYSLNGQAQEILDRGCKAFIQKPFDVERLSQKIREALLEG